MKSGSSTRRPPVWRVLLALGRVSAVLAALYMVACSLVAQPMLRTNDTSPHLADEARLRAHVDALGEEFRPRDWQNEANLMRCADYIAAELRRAGAVVEHQDYEAIGRNYRNVIGRFGVGKERKIIVGAHYDAYDEFPGADDNASAVAGLLELAWMIAADPPDAEVELVGYTLEEPPFFGSSMMGSAIHAASVAAERERIIGVIVLEMIGYFSDEPGSQDYPLPLMTLFYPSRGDFITVVSRWNEGAWVKALKGGMKGATPLPVYSFRGPASLPGVDFSDHRNYWPHDIPAAMVTNTAFFRNKAYHTPEDTADRLDYRRLGMVVTGVHAAMLRVAAKRD